MTFKPTLVLSAITLVLGGCATSSITQDQLKSQTGKQVSKQVAKFEESAKPLAAVREIDQPLVDFKRTEAPRIRGDINIRAAAAPFAPLITELGKASGYSVAFADTVDANRKITIQFTDAVSEDAIRTAAFLAGYVAVIDKRNRTIMVSDVATYTFRVPSGVFSALQAQYNVGGNPANASGGSGGAGGGGGGGTSLKAEFSVSGKEGGVAGGLTKYLQDLAGRNAEVIVTEGGHISVRGNAQALRRINDFMRGFIKDAMTQVEIEASVIEVALAKEFALGIQWGRVIENASAGVMLGGSASQAIAGAVVGASPTALLSSAVAASSTGSFSTFRSNATSGSLITALSRFTDVNIVSQPKLVSMNNVPATFFDGTQLPYLGSVQQTANQGDTGPTMSGSVAFAIDGVSFSAVPSVVNDNTVQITLIPVLSSVNGYDKFLNDTLVAPRQGNKQTYMRVLAESGKTLILGGIRYNKEAKETNVPNSTSSSGSSKEVVILLRANVISGPDFDPVVTESL